MKPTILLCVLGAALLSTAPAPQLALLTSTSARGAGERTVSGDVENISQDAIRGIVVTATWYDTNKHVVSSSIGLMKDEPLAPGQRTTYKVSAKAKPSMASYSVTFKSVHDDRAIPTEDRRR